MLKSFLSESFSSTQNCINTFNKYGNVNCHRCCTRRSEYFRGMFSSSWSESGQVIIN